MTRQREPLTDREAEVAKWIRQGKTNNEIAIILGIARGTVNKHVERILNKLRVENRTAAALAFQELSDQAKARRATGEGNTKNR